MRQAKLGGLEVGAIGLGCMTMTDAYGVSDRDEAERTLLRAVDLGVTLFDTANGYGLGENEQLVGRVLAPHRDRVCIATKFGFVVDGGRPRIDGHPDQVEDRCDESLKRLAIDVIDLYFLHRPDPEVPIEDTVGAMARLVEAGKVRYLGVCEVSPETLRRGHAVHPISAVQSEYSLWTRDPEQGVLAVCEELGIGFVPFSPLGRAILTGTIKSSDQVDQKSDYRSTMPRFHGDNLKANLELVSGLEDIAASLSVKPGQVALAWLLARGEHIAPIPGTRRRTYLEENVEAANIELDDDAVADLDALFVPERVAGARYGQSWMQSKDTA
ncbi:MAG: aldo/keto reductase [Acidobacteria bacterium]|nr:aldo/keto reductase [Acidobacteriota bacterium]MCY3971866.1 aldo/keto reductase [Acidobacteriota bacterium]